MRFNRYEVTLRISDQYDISYRTAHAKSELRVEAEFRGNDLRQLWSRALERHGGKPSILNVIMKIKFFSVTKIFRHIS